MRRIKFLFILISLGLIWLLPASAFALDPPEFGGNNSSDYQPPTGNPQNNTPAPLQPTKTSLQPVTLLNQQALIQSGGLSVLTAPDKGATSTAGEPITAKKVKSTMPTWIIGGLLTLAAVAYILFRPDHKNDQLDTMAVKSAQPKQPAAAPKSKTTKKPTKKTSRKKRKSTPKSGV